MLHNFWFFIEAYQKAWKKKQQQQLQQIKNDQPLSTPFPYTTGNPSET